MNRMYRAWVFAFIAVIVLGGKAYAHGGMAGPDELGPPMGMSIAIGLACYYLITLWPSHRRNARRNGTKVDRRSAR